MLLFGNNELEDVSRFTFKNNVGYFQLFKFLHDPFGQNYYKDYLKRKQLLCKQFIWPGSLDLKIYQALMVRPD